MCSVLSSTIIEFSNLLNEVKELRFPIPVHPFVATNITLINVPEVNSSIKSLKMVGYLANTSLIHNG
jgi:hypothetical protein